MDDRWSLPDLESTRTWCRSRAGHGIRCIVARMEEYSRTPAEAATRANLQAEAIRGLAKRVPGISFSVKPSSLGLLMDPALFFTHLGAIAREARLQGVPLEIDTEGRPLVDGTLRAAFALPPDTRAGTVALQAYLDRTPRDLEDCLRAGIRARLVKGAYIGDTNDPDLIRDRFRTLAGTLAAAGVAFSAGTHDPVLIAWLQERTADRPGLVEFSFLKGLSDRTKLDLAGQGRKVSEYVPFGPGGDSYRLRRIRYLELLDRRGEVPAP